MSIGNSNKESVKKNNHSWQRKMLNNAASSTSLLSAILAELIKDFDFEIKCVRDPNTGVVYIMRIQKDETNGNVVVDYINADGTAAFPPDPSILEVCDASALLTLILNELLDQGLTLDQIDLNTDDVATQTTLAALLAAFIAEDFASETTLSALNAKFNTLGQKASADSHPVVLSTEQEAILQAMADALDVDLSTLATEATLNAIKLVTDQLSFDGNSALEVALPAGTNTSFYSRALGSGIIVPAGAKKVSIMNIGNDNVNVTTDSSPLAILDPGIRLEWVAEEGKDLGAFTFGNTSASSLYVVTQVR